MKLESDVQLKVLQSCSVYTTVMNMHTLVQFSFVVERTIIQFRAENHPYATCVLIRMILFAELNLSYVQDFLPDFCGFFSVRRDREETAKILQEVFVQETAKLLREVFVWYVAHFSGLPFVHGEQLHLQPSVQPTCAEAFCAFSIVCRILHVFFLTVR